jgi:hypothetical protein
MTATRTFKEVKDHPLFPRFSKGDGRWHHTGPDGTVTPCGDFRSESSRFGSVEYAVVVDDTGAPVFDRPMYRETPNVHIVAYGRDSEGAVRIAIIRQPRPHADDPSVQKGQKHDPVVFGQVQMGFLEKLIGKDLIPRQEKSDAGAVRETLEETGALAVIKAYQPEWPYMFPNPTFCATWSDVWFLEIDLSVVEQVKHDRNEPIFSAEFITVPELLKRIREGKDEQGALYRMGISLADLMLFLLENYCLARNDRLGLPNTPFIVI